MATYRDPYSTQAQDFGGRNDGGYSSSYELSDEKMPSDKSLGLVSQWRRQDRGKMLSRGGGLKSFGRCFACTIMFTLVLIIGIVFSLALFIRPPNVTFESFKIGNANVTTTSLDLSVGAVISVSNPNYFSATFKRLEVEAFYPISGNPKFGGGEMKDLTFGSGDKTTFTFPFALNYTRAADPSNVIIQDIVDRCGILGNAKKDMQVKYKIDTAIKILSITVSPTISNTFSFTCPFTEAQLKDIMGDTV